jgi:Carbohydrate-binding module 48 (Isoamylase N-terminal domain)
MSATPAAQPTGTLPGSEFPLGATVTEAGTNFAVASEVADGMFDDTGAETRISMRNYDASVWHAFVPGVAAGQAYGYRAAGPWDPARGVRCNPGKLLLDPYARALHGTVTFGPEVLGHSASDPERSRTTARSSPSWLGLSRPGANLTSGRSITCADSWMTWPIWSSSTPAGLMRSRGPFGLARRSGICGRRRPVGLPPRSNSRLADKIERRATGRSSR